MQGITARPEISAGLQYFPYLLQEGLYGEAGQLLQQVQAGDQVEAAVLEGKPVQGVALYQGRHAIGPDPRQRQHLRGQVQSRQHANAAGLPMGFQQQFATATSQVQQTLAGT